MISGMLWLLAYVVSSLNLISVASSICCTLLSIDMYIEVNITPFLVLMFVLTVMRSRFE